jgi:hypothetical protein
VACEGGEGDSSLALGRQGAPGHQEGSLT